MVRSRQPRVTRFEHDHARNKGLADCAQGLKLSAHRRDVVTRRDAGNRHRGGRLARPKNRSVRASFVGAGTIVRTRVRLDGVSPNSQSQGSQRRRVLPQLHGVSCAPLFEPDNFSNRRRQVSSLQPLRLRSQVCRQPRESANGGRVTLTAQEQGVTG